ncbi:septum formation initiator family protein [Sporolactobacillus sp. CPB3-1]|uniref:Septum formation initiator family protein n=1 Tax=Sporolactobacillus mangiferae TaxID=2940498 RepID=A0ABT0MC75_9BACL|nr:septum formation initiator family protein [Sporolactobacillus mangiferae]MCL1632474.1 septum formation initiator family protein [Sporolactobacillus mangiferae]
MAIIISEAEMIGGSPMESAGAERVTRLQTQYLHTHELDEKRKRKRRRGLIRRLIAFFVVFALACTFMITTLFSQSHKLSQAGREKVSLQKQLTQSKSQAVDLKKRIQLLHNKEYIGEVARRDYLLSKKGEIIFAKPERSKD